MKELTPAQVTAGLHGLTAAVEAMTCAVSALAAAVPDHAQLMQLYDGCTDILMANQQGRPFPEEYLQALEAQVGRVRRFLEAASPPPEIPPEGD